MKNTKIQLLWKHIDGENQREYADVEHCNAIIRARNKKIRKEKKEKNETK